MVPCFSWRMSMLVGGTLLVSAIITAAYLISMGSLSAAREARRDDNYSEADRLLAACWRLPGLRSAIDLEDQLLGVQQGDLKDEKE